MGLGKWLVVIGLAANIAGTACIGWIVPRYSLPIVSSSGPASRAVGAGVFAERYGWLLLAIGFALQLVGTVLWT